MLTNASKVIVKKPNIVKLSWICVANQLKV